MLRIRVGTKLKKNVEKKIEENSEVVKAEEKNEMNKQSLSSDDNENAVVEGEVVDEDMKGEDKGVK